METRRTCKATGKVCYTKREAGVVVNGTKKHVTTSHLYKGSARPKRSYFCSECGSYHTTHLRNETERGYRKKPMKTLYGKGYNGDDDFGKYEW